MDEKKAKENSIKSYSNSVIKSRKIGRVKGKLTRNQRIAYNVFLKTAYETLLQDSNQNKFKINLRKFLNLAGLKYENYHSLLFTDTKEYKSIKTLLKELQTKTYELEWRDKKNKPYKVLSASLLSQFIMSEDKDYIEFEFPSFIRESILAHQNFYILYLPVIVSMKSSYSIALYEQILQRKEFNVWYVNKGDFRGLMGVGEGEYTLAKNFDQRVLKPAVSEINKILDISLTYKKIKKGRRIIAYEFHWNFKRAKEKLQTETLHNKQINGLLSIVPDISVSVLQNALQRYSFNEVKNAVLIIAEKRKEMHIKNVNAYLVSVLKNGANKDLLAKEREKKEREKEIERMIQLQEQREKYELLWWNKRVEEELKTMSDEEKKEIWERVNEITRGLASKETSEILFRNEIKKRLQSNGVKPPDFTPSTKEIDKAKEKALINETASLVLAQIHTNEEYTQLAHQITAALLQSKGLKKETPEFNHLMESVMREVAIKLNTEEKLPTDEDLEQIYRKVDEETNAGDSVPIPDFFDAVKQAFPDVTRDWLLGKLLELDDAGVIYLSEANDPNELERKEFGIEIKGRGFLFYITWLRG